jgi:hypothetical protein
MKPNFNYELDLRGGGERVAAWGPCNWCTAPDARLVRIDNVRVEQGTVVATSPNWDDRRMGQADWSLELRTDNGDRLAPGDAHAWGTATVLQPPGGNPWPWDQPVRLN